MTPPASDIQIASMEPILPGRILLTGRYGDDILSLGERYSSLNLAQEGQAGMSGSLMNEFRLRVGFQQFPPLFTGWQHLRAVQQLGRSSEMKPWSIGGDYDRPLARRILEEAGVPRSYFGSHKMGGAHLNLTGARDLCPTSQADLKDAVQEEIIKPVIGEWLTDDPTIHINPTGKFEVGGPLGDAGLTGRKIIVDTYGGAAPHGGGAFSGKDPTKVDRSAAYITRYLAKNIVAAGLARRCTIQLSYAIGVSKPLSIYVDTHGTAAEGVTDEALETAIRGIEKLGGLTPRGIRTHLGLNKPIYRKSAAYGHFGRQAEGDAFPWERTDLVDDLKAALGR